MSRRRRAETTGRPRLVGPSSAGTSGTACVTARGSRLRCVGHSDAHLSKLTHRTWPAGGAKARMRRAMSATVDQGSVGGPVDALDTHHTQRRTLCIWLKL